MNIKSFRAYLNALDALKQTRVFEDPIWIVVWFWNFILHEYVDHKWVSLITTCITYLMVTQKSYLKLHYAVNFYLGK